MNNRRYETLLVVLFGIGLGLVMLDRMAINFLFPVLVKEFGLNNTHIGQIILFQTLGWAIFGLVFSILADRTGYKKWLMVPLLVLTTVFSAGSAFTVGLTSLILMRFFLGIVEGPYTPLYVSILHVQTDPKRFAVAVGLVVGIAGIIGGLIAPLLVTQLLVRYDWHWAFIVSSLPTLVLAILIGLYVKEVKTTSAVDGASVEKADWSDFAKLLKYRNVVLCIVLIVLSMLAMWSFFVYSPLYWVQLGKMSEQSMGFIMSATGVSVIFWNFVIPAISNRIGRKTVLIVFAPILACMFLVMYFSVGTVAQILFVILGGIAGALPSLLFIIGTESVPRTLATTSPSLIMGVGELLGGAVGTGTMGALADLYGLQTVMIIIAGALILFSAVSFGLIETSPHLVSKKI
ncbi:MAG: MFS transporter [Deltaproteobacteria bacterium]|nr:MFS transporter [Deltaproteobacteria bacterium]